LLLLGAAALGGCDEKALVLLDRTAPEIEISSPDPDATVSGVAFQIAVDATDDEGVDRVEFRVDGASPQTDTTAPFSATIVTLATVSGAQLLVRAEAFDAAGNSASATVLVEVAPRSVERLTDDVGDDMNPAWSPDGTRIAFQSDRNGAQFDLWVMNANGSGQTRLTQDVNEDRNPAWSPDGNWIAFDSDRAGGYDVWKLPVATGEMDAVALTSANNDDIQPAWSPDGTSVYFSSSRGVNADFNVWRMLAGGDDLATTTQATAFPEDDTAPAVSPAGGVLAFASPLNFVTNHIYTMEIGEVQVFPLTGDVGFTEVDPAWSPDGSVVLFSRSEGLDSNLWVMPLGALVPVQVTFGSGVVGDGGAAWSPDGDRIAFHSDRDGNLDIFVVQ
jgi:TolB protein